jgi:hypothetical protein
MFLQVAKQALSTAQAKNTHFYLELGDNFYEDGVVDVNDIRFKVRA